jgi:hypothetical protein
MQRAPACLASCSTASHKALVQPQAGSLQGSTAVARKHLIQGTSRSVDTEPRCSLRQASAGMQSCTAHQQTRRDNCCPRSWACHHHRWHAARQPHVPLMPQQLEMRWGCSSSCMQLHAGIRISAVHHPLHMARTPQTPATHGTPQAPATAHPTSNSVPHNQQRLDNKSPK